MSDVAADAGIAPTLYDFSAGADPNNTISLVAVDGDHFNVSIMHLSVHSEVFRDMFASAKDEGTPIKLEETSIVLNTIFTAMMQRPLVPDARIGSQLSEIMRACRKYGLSNLTQVIFCQCLYVYVRSGRRKRADFVNIDFASSLQIEGSSPIMLEIATELGSDLEVPKRLLEWNVKAGVGPSADFQMAFVRLLKNPLAMRADCTSTV